MKKTIGIKTTAFLTLAISAMLLPSTAMSADDAADDNGNYVLTLKDHQFTPATMTIPANQKVKITVKNEDDTVAEFESSDFNREKIVSARSAITIFIGPLSSGSYGYFDDFHRETVGTIVAK